ncbi:MAG TPA: ABC transporter ATP-binding protein [Candidatus Binatia bacterium]|nr:ABC transporter ATP-binding protein [Candidatus Binatia bacterium]
MQAENRASATWAGPTTQAAPIVVTEHLFRRFGSLVAVDDLSLRVERGQIFGFLGPNGAGKTTTIKMLCGLLRPSEGRAHVAGFAVESQQASIKRATGYMAQQFSLYPDLTVEENFEFFAGVYGIHGRAAARRMDALFEPIDLDGLREVQAGQLSGGMKQRLALACALVHEPALVFLDEPTAGLDPSQRQRLWNFLYDLCDRGTSLFLTTHYLDEAERCHSVGFMLRGRLIAQGPPPVLRSKLRGRMAGAQVQRPVEAMRILRELPGIDDVTIHGHDLRILFSEAGDGPAQAARLERTAAAAGAPLEHVYPLEPTLEDLFISYARGGVAPP